MYLFSIFPTQAMVKGSTLLSLIQKLFCKKGKYYCLHFADGNTEQRG